MVACVVDAVSVVVVVAVDVVNAVVADYCLPSVIFDVILTT
jgi:hypothetical protein